ncbi:hypothetical protein K491DRAFT_612434, partial [Lophiostoma macrostomum CBS 122681]
ILHVHSSIPTMAPAISIRTEVRIKAPVTEVWIKLIDTSTWPDWNSLVPRAEISDTPPDSNKTVLALGCRCHFTVMINGTNRPSTQKVTVFDVPEDGHPGPRIYRITWVIDDYPSILFRTERFNELEEVAGENGPECIYRTGEDQSGPLAYVVKMLFGKAVDQGIRAWPNELKTYIEQKEVSSESRQVE